MERFKDFDINIVSLKPGEHEFEFNFDSKFFQEFEESIVKAGKGLVRLMLTRSETFIKLDFTIEGIVELTCDRSLDNYDFSIDSTNSILLKFGEGDHEIDDEIVIIDWHTQTINVAQFIYEFISLSIPMKKLHPRFESEDINMDDEFVYSSKEEIEEDDSAENSAFRDLRDLLDKKNKEEK